MVIEDGTGKTDSNSYVSVTFADNYFSSRGFSSWEELEDEDKEILLIKATDFIDNIFQWNGKKKTYEQALNFPRENLIDNNGYVITDIPVNLKQAVCEAVEVLVNGSSLFQSASENGAVTSEKIGELSFTYDVSQKVKDTTLYDSINTRLRGLFCDKSKTRIFSAQVQRV